LLSLCSPVLHKMLCGNFMESTDKKITLYDVDAFRFGKVLDLWCGRVNELELSEVRQLASLADRFQISEVLSVLEEAMVVHLRVGFCAEVLSWSGGAGFHELEEKAQSLAAERFEEVAQTNGFMEIGEEALGCLLDNDGLAAKNEEAVWKALVRWMRAEEGQVRGRGLVGKIRFPLMEEVYLRSQVVGMMPAEDAEWMEEIVGEALRAKAAGSDGKGFKFEFLGRKALVRRAQLGVKWEEYTDGDELRMTGGTQSIHAIAACEGRICSGSDDGSILVWSRATAQIERTLEPGGTGDAVYALAEWKGVLISGHDSGKLMVWNVVTGVCNQVLECHNSRVSALAVCGSRLASGSWGECIKVWAIGAGAPWVCERTLLNRTCQGLSLAVWQDKVLCASRDGRIHVYDVETGALDATLAGYQGEIYSFAVLGDRVWSASDDGIICEWDAETWAAVRTVEVYEPGSWKLLFSMVVSGSKLVCGLVSMEAIDPDDDPETEVLVFDLKTLDLQHTLQQPDKADVEALVAVDGEVWASVGTDVVVWGRQH
jgi:hypothetical protein